LCAGIARFLEVITP
jgi:hypothetical protein